MSTNGKKEPATLLSVSSLQDMDEEPISSSPLNLHTLLDIEDFNGRVVAGYNTGIAEQGLPADVGIARSLVGPGTGAHRDFSYIAPEIPEFIQENCVGCMDCGEATALRMMPASTGYLHGPENLGLVASTGCNTVYTSTYPYNPYTIPWTNSLFENGPTDAMGVRARWNQIGWHDKKIWVIGGDGAMLDIGFQALSRMLMSGMDINVLVLDTQVYSNTGGQASTSSYMGQNTKMSVHGVGDHLAGHQAKLAMESRAFPIFIYDPRNGERIKERLDLKGNPAVKDDWYTIRKTGETVDFVTFARTEGRFAKQFNRDGNPSETLMAAQEDRLQELAHAPGDGRHHLKTRCKHRHRLTHEKPLEVCLPGLFSSSSAQPA